MRKFIQILTTLMQLTACTKEGDIIYQPDPADQASRAPLVTDIYDPNAVGDSGYNDLIYQGVCTTQTEATIRAKLNLFINHNL